MLHCYTNSIRLSAGNKASQLCYRINITSNHCIIKQGVPLCTKEVIWARHPGPAYRKDLSCRRRTVGWSETSLVGLQCTIVQSQITRKAASEIRYCLVPGCSKYIDQRTQLCWCDSCWAASFLAMASPQAASFADWLYSCETYACDNFYNIWGKTGLVAASSRHQCMFLTQDLASKTWKFGFIYNAADLKWVTWRRNK